MDFFLGKSITPYINKARSTDVTDYKWRELAWSVRKSEKSIGENKALLLVDPDTFYFLLSMSTAADWFSPCLMSNWKHIHALAKRTTSDIHESLIQCYESLYMFCDNPSPEGLSTAQQNWCKLHLADVDCTEIDRKITECFGNISALWNTNLTYNWNESNFDRNLYVPSKVKTNITTLIQDVTEYYQGNRWTVDWEKIADIMSIYNRDINTTGELDFTKKNFMESEQCYTCVQDAVVNHDRYGRSENMQFRAILCCERELLSMADNDFAKFISKLDDPSSDVRQFCETQQNLINEFLNAPSGDQMRAVQKAILTLEYTNMMNFQLHMKMFKALGNSSPWEKNSTLGWNPSLNGYANKYKIDAKKRTQITYYPSNRCYHSYVFE